MYSLTPPPSILRSSGVCTPMIKKYQSINLVTFFAFFFCQTVTALVVLNNNAFGVSVIKCALKRPHLALVEWRFFIAHRFGFFSVCSPRPWPMRATVSRSHVRPGCVHLRYEGRHREEKTTNQNRREGKCDIIVLIERAAQLRLIFPFFSVFYSLLSRCVTSRLT